MADTTTTLLPVRGLAEHTDNAFRAKLVRVSRAAGAEPSYVAACISFETGGTFDPAIRNPQSKFVGLIQFGDQAAAMLATTRDKLAAMSALEQLDYVGAYFRKVGQGRLRTVADHYLAVFAPVGIGHDGSFVLYAAPTKAYDQNKGLDRSGDGTVTVSEAVAPVEGIVARARQQMPILVTDEDSGGGSSQSSGGSGGTAVIAVAVLFGGLILSALKRLGGIGS
jgi:hypothetical protein